MAAWQLGRRSRSCSPQETLKILAAEPLDAENARKCSLRSLRAPKMFENPRSLRTSNAPKTSLRSLLTSKNDRKRLLPSLLTSRMLENPSLPSFLTSRIARKDFHGVERAIENAFRNPGLEDASLDEASLRAFNARVHTSL